MPRFRRMRPVAVFLICILGLMTAVYAGGNAGRGSISVETPETFSRDIAAFWDEGGNAFMREWNAGHLLRWQETATAGKDSEVRYSAYLDGLKIFGVSAEHIALKEDGGKLCEIEIMFFNKGDTASRLGFGMQSTKSNREKREFSETAWKDCRTEIRRNLEKSGKPRREKIGSAKLRRSVEIWTCGGNEFLLDAKEGEFVRVFIVPKNRLNRLTDPTPERAKGNLRENVVHRDNGDVLIENIPMVDQGQKGYCVPATIERVLHYYGISEPDMHTIADLAGTDAGGGTLVSQLVRGLSPVVKKNRLSFETFRMQFQKIRQSVDKGVPMLWSMSATPEYMNRLKDNTFERKQAENFDDFATKLKKREPLKVSPRDLSRYAHLCLIIGYNPKTKEICISDSWGEHTAEQWIAFDDAFAVRHKAVPLHVLEK